MLDEAICSLVGVDCTADLRSPLGFYTRSGRCQRGKLVAVVAPIHGLRTAESHLRRLWGNNDEIASFFCKTILFGAVHQSGFLDASYESSVSARFILL